MRFVPKHKSHSHIPCSWNVENGEIDLWHGMEVIMKFDRDKLTKEMIEQAMQCKNAQELLEMCQKAGFEMTAEEAESYMSELEDFELDEELLRKSAGGIFECYMRNNCGYIGDDWK